MFTIQDKTARRRLDVQEEALLAIAKRLDDYGESLGALQTPVRDLTMEWEDWFEKFRNLYSRIAKRQDREAGAEKAEAPEPNGALPPDVNPLALQLLQGKDDS